MTRQEKYWYRWLLPASDNLDNDYTDHHLKKVKIK
jgi:hypothetical protein